MDFHQAIWHSPVMECKVYAANLAKLPMNIMAEVPYYRGVVSVTCQDTQKMAKKCIFKRLAKCNILSVLGTKSLVQHLYNHPNDQSEFDTMQTCIQSILFPLSLRYNMQVRKPRAWSNMDIQGCSAWVGAQSGVPDRGKPPKQSYMFS